MNNQFKKSILKNRQFHISLITISLLLIAVLTFNFVVYKPVVAQAAPSKVYIQDIKIITCKESEFNDESRKLRAEGYIIDKNYNFGDQEVGENVLDNPNGERAYLAYKTTRDPNIAITDFSVMNMKGPYSFAEYEKLLEDQRKVMDTLVKNLAEGIKLFRRNYQAKTPASVYAHKMLNNYFEDDSKMNMGDFILNVDITGEATTLHKVAMQSQSAVLSQIVQWVAIACATVAGEDDWLTKLSSMDEEAIALEEGRTVNDASAIILLETINIVNNDYVRYDKFLNELKDTLGKEDFNPADAEEKVIFESLLAKYYKEYDEYTSIDATFSVLSSLPYSNSKFTYSPLGEFAGENANKGALVNLFLTDQDELDFPDLYPMASVLTKEQVAMIKIAGINPFITSALSTEKDWRDAANKVDEMVKYNYDNIHEITPVTSIYTGVDRSLFNAKGIALTDEAARRGFVDKEDSWLHGNIPIEYEWVLYGAMILGGLGMIAGAAYSYAKSGALFATYNNFWDAAANKAAKFAEQGRQYTNLISNVKRISVIQNKAGIKSQWFIRDYLVCTKNVVGGAIFLGAMFLVMLAVTIYLIVELIYYYEKNYTDIPQIIFNNFTKNDKSIYVRYDAVLNQKNDFADINIDGREWVVPYITKDPNAGNPIVADFVLKRSAADAIPSEYSPLSRLGDKARYNVHTNSSADPLYFGFKRDANAFPKTGSTFSAGEFTLALCGGILAGGALGWFGTYLIIKKKRKNKVLLIENNTSEKA